MKLERGVRRGICCLAYCLSAMAALSLAAAPRPQSCEKVVLLGEVSAGQEWKADFGEGWTFRVLPIAPGKAGYSGWDLVVDREQPVGYPDALLVATPPYNSINEREVGTTYGLRAQDAIGWNPRSFHFLTNPGALRESQKLYFSLGSTAVRNTAQRQSATVAATRRLMELEKQSAAGELRILDARLTPGIADAAPYAENWAVQSARTNHSNEPATRGASTPLGELHWMRFSITLWLPERWKAPRELHAARGACD
ncbi:MAG: hypothetical protein P4K94_08235 [Terracidiphilus sp.]|nr:hypothetical protein [Terracidiphilus sp.]